MKECSFCGISMALQPLIRCPTNSEHRVIQYHAEESKRAQSGFCDRLVVQNGSFVVCGEDKPCKAHETGSSVDHPAHYNVHPSGVECIQVVEHMSFNVGNAIKYLWRADEKGSPIQDLEKAAWYVNREIERRKKMEK